MNAHGYTTTGPLSSLRLVAIGPQSARGCFVQCPSCGEVVAAVPRHIIQHACPAARASVPAAPTDNTEA